jgi:hypothetical protein
MVKISMDLDIKELLERLIRAASMFGEDDTLVLEIKREILKRLNT